MVIDPSLTQAQWEKYTREVSAISSFKSLASAEPLGKLNFTVGITTRPHPWISTILPGSTPLRIRMRTVPWGTRSRFPRFGQGWGFPARWMWAAIGRQRLGANYGIVGGEFKYAFLRESAKVSCGGCQHILLDAHRSSRLQSQHLQRRIAGEQADRDVHAVSGRQGEPGHRNGNDFQGRPGYGRASRLRRDSSAAPMPFGGLASRPNTTSPP